MVCIGSGFGNSFAKTFIVWFVFWERTMFPNRNSDELMKAFCDGELEVQLVRNRWSSKMMGHP